MALPYIGFLTKATPVSPSGSLNWVLRFGIGCSTAGDFRTGRDFCTSPARDRARTSPSVRLAAWSSRPTVSPQRPPPDRSGRHQKSAIALVTKADPALPGVPGRPPTKAQVVSRQARENDSVDGRLR